MNQSNVIMVLLSSVKRSTELSVLRLDPHLTWTLKKKKNTKKLRDGLRGLLKLQQDNLHNQGISL